MINGWINAFMKPSETFAAEKANANIGKGVINFLIAGVIAGIVSTVFAVLTVMLSGNTDAVMTGLLAGVAAIIFTPIFLVIGAFITVGVFFIIAKMLGGQGSFTSMFYLASLYAVPYYFLASIPVIGILAWLYGIFLVFKVIKESQQLSGGKVIAVILIPGVIMALIMVLIIAFVGMAVLSMFSSIAPVPTGNFGLI